MLFSDVKEGMANSRIVTVSLFETTDYNQIGNIRWLLSKLHSNWDMLKNTQRVKWKDTTHSIEYACIKFAYGTCSNTFTFLRVGK